MRLVTEEEQQLENEEGLIAAEEESKQLMQQMERNEKIDQENAENEKHIISLLQDLEVSSLVPEDVMKKVSYSVLFTPKDVKDILKAHNQMKINIQEEIKKQKLIQENLDRASADLNEQLAKEAPNVEEIAARLADDAIAKEKAFFQR